MSTSLRLILPTSASVLPAPDVPETAKITTLVITGVSIALEVIAFALAGTTDRCAPQGKREPGLKTEASDSSNGAAAKYSEVLKPVTAFSSCSPVSFILFSWMTPVLNKGAKIESLSQDDLPALCANDRAPNLFSKMKLTTSDTRPKWINGLLWRVLVVNKTLFYWREATYPARCT